MIKLYKRNNLYSTSKLANSEPVELVEETYFGCRITFDNYHKPVVTTLCDNQFRITAENLDVLVKSSRIINGVIHDALSWQPYKRKYYLLPNGVLDLGIPNYGDIVEPLVEKTFHPSVMIYLGKFHVVTYDPLGRKSVRKDQHVLIGMDKSSNNMIIVHATINSAFVKISNDTAHADSLVHKLNFGSSLRHYHYEWPTDRVFYFKDFKATKAIPKLINADNASAKLVYHSGSYATDCPDVAVKSEIGMYVIQSGLGTMDDVRNITDNGNAHGYKIDEIDIVNVSNQELENYHVMYPYKTKKMSYDNLIRIPNKKPNEYFMIVYEIYQGGKLIGRK